MKNLKDQDITDAVARLTAAVRANQRATGAFDAAAARRLGVDRTAAAALDVIDEAGGRATPGALGERLGLTSGAVTALLDRLAAAGLVERGPDPADRRRVIVTLTPTARRRVAAIFGPLARDGAAVFAGYDADQLALVAELLEKATRVLAGRIRTL